MFKYILASILIGMSYCTTSVAYIENKMPVVVKGELKKKLVPYTTSEESTLAYNSTISLVQNGKNIEAASELQKILDINPNFHIARVKLIHIMNKNKQYKEMELLLNKGLELEPNHPGYLKYLATLKQAEGNHKEAISILLNMPAKNRNDADCRAVMALAYFHQGFYDLAIKQYAKLVRHEYRNSHYWLGLAVAQDAVGDSARALNSFNKVISLGSVEVEVLQYAHERIEKLAAIKT